MNTKDLTGRIEEETKALRIRGLIKSRTESLEEFLTKFFTDWNHNKPTVYVGNGHTQTEPGKRRSIGDIYAIAKYYYPVCTLKEVSNVVYSRLSKSVPRFRSSLCSMIHKRVFYQGEEGSETQFFPGPDEFGMTPAAWRKL